MKRSRRAPVRIDRDRGFTLLEMMVALAILGMLSGLVFAGIKAGAQGLHRIGSGQSAMDEIVSVQTRLRETIGRLRPEQRLDSSARLVDVRGSAHDLAFFAPPQASDSPDELKRYRLLLTATGNLVLYQGNGLDERIDLDAPGLVGWQPIPLLDGVAQVDLAYFGSIPSHERGWQVSWYNRPQPPELVRIRVQFVPGDHRSWPDLLIRPAATSSSPCQLDALTSHCQPG